MPDLSKPRALARPVSLLTSDFASVGAPALAALNRIAVRRVFAGGEFVYLQDAEACHLHLVSSGHVRLSNLMEDGSVVLHAVLPRGQVFGELGVFENSTYCDMATAAGPLVSLSFPATAFRALCREHPAVWDVLSRVVARRYRSYITMTRDLSLKSLPARLAQALLRMADGLESRILHGGVQVACVGAVVTQADFGLMARGSRTNVNRALKAWEREGWIAMHERCILILKRERLETLALVELS